MSSTLGRLVNRLTRGSPMPSTPSLACRQGQQSTQGVSNEAAKWHGSEYKSDADASIARSLASHFDLSTFYAKLLVKRKLCFRNGARVASANERVRKGDTVSIPTVLLKPKPAVLTKEIDVLYRDADIVVINKPPSLAVHGGKGIGEEDETLQHWIAQNFADSDYRPALLHRLDKEASGALLLALNADAAARWAKAMREPFLDDRLITKTDRRARIASMIYEGRTRPMTSHALDRNDISDEGRVAISHYHHATTYIRKTEKPRHRVKLAMLEWSPKTGRKHQLRVHAAEQLGCPILGDTKYAKGANWALAHRLGGSIPATQLRAMVTRLHLHCRQIVLKGYFDQGHARRLARDGAAVGDTADTLAIRGDAGSKDLVVEAPLPKHWVETMRLIPAFWRIKPKHTGFRY